MRKTVTEDYWNKVELWHNLYYKGFVSFFLKKRYKKIFALIQKINPYKKDALDIGCGSGEYFLLLHKLGANVYGIDKSKKMVVLARENLKKQNILSSLVVGDAAKIPLNKKFDVVLLIGVLDYVDKVGLVIDECHRICKEDFLVTAPRKFSPFLIFRRSNFLREKLLNLPPLLNTFTLGQLNTLLKNKFKIVEYSTIMGTMYLLHCKRI